MDYEKEIPGGEIPGGEILGGEIPFGAFDSELMHQEIFIPEGFEATIDGDKIILTRKESKDEKVRKAIIELVKQSSEILDMQNQSNMLAWLEKQGQHKRFRDSIQVGDNVTKNEYDELVNLSQLNRVAKRDADILKKQSEQKSTTIDVDKMVSDYASHNEKRNEIFGKPVPCMVRAYKQGICDTLESLGEEKPFEKEFTFKAIPRLLDMIEPSDRAKAYCQKLIDTLAKEGYNTDAKIVEGVLNGWNGENVPMAVMDEKQGEQKSSTEVKPKFHEGDWIVDNIGVAHQIEKTVLNVTNNTFGYDIVGGGYFNDDSDVHLWTIQDAKDGDVLCTYECEEPKIVFILKGTPKKHYALSYYCYYNIMYPHFDDGNKPGCLAPEDSDVKPATKEQRDLLFTKRKEAGFEWDSEKKELKKISQHMISAEAKEAMYDKPTDNDMVEALRTEYEKGRADAFAEMQKEWSEEDKDFMYDTLSNLTELKDRYGEGYGNVGKCIDWLKILKQRIGGEV